MGLVHSLFLPDNGLRHRRSSEYATETRSRRDGHDRNNNITITDNIETTFKNTTILD